MVTRLDVATVAQVRCLRLDRNDIQDEGALSTAASPYLQDVDSLYLSENRIGRQAVEKPNAFVNA